MIVCTVTADETRRGSRGVVWIADAEVDGVRYEAESQQAPSCALARKLVDAGIPDQPMEVRQTGLAGSLNWPSLHHAAKRSISEGNAAVHSVAYTPMPDTPAFASVWG